MHIDSDVDKSKSTKSWKEYEAQIYIICQSRYVRSTVKYDDRIVGKGRLLEEH